MKLKKSILGLGAAMMMLGAGAGAANAASYKGISVTPVLQQGTWNTDVEFAIKNDNAWNTTSNVNIQEKQPDGTWQYVGYATAIKLVPEEKEYIDVEPTAFKESGTYRYETHTTKDTTGLDIGTFYSEPFSVSVYVAPTPSETEYTPTWDQAAQDQAAVDYEAEQYEKNRLTNQANDSAAHWDEIMAEREAMGGDSYGAY